MTAFPWAGSLALLSLFAVGTASAADRNPLAEHVRAANDRFKDVAVAVSEGYAPIPCASGIEGGAMGIHYVNAKLIGDTIDDSPPPRALIDDPVWMDGDVERTPHIVLGRGSLRWTSVIVFLQKTQPSTAVSNTSP